MGLQASSCLASLCLLGAGGLRQGISLPTLTHRQVQVVPLGQTVVSSQPSALVMGRATGTQEVTASLLQVPVEHL